MHKNFEIELKKYFSLYLMFSAILHRIERNLFIAATHFNQTNTSFR